MNLAKQLEGEIIQAYNSFWVANLSADMERFASYLVNDFSIFGSANGEIFFNRQEAVAFYTATSEEIRDKAQLRNRDISVQPLDDNSVIVREMCDLYVLIGDSWTFYGHGRISCILKQIDNEWKVLHQHTSFPDHRTEEGQQLATEKIEKENLELREAVERRTVELELKNRELEAARKKAEDTLIELQAAQKQLILAEKMASLGEMTAGIAHEIQNPLNFVNNFSEVNSELIKELDEAASYEPRDASYEADIRKNIKENSEKINHHGKRADAIVKSMLQHSRGNESGNKKEPTDINALADEYFRLAYHGLKAKDKTFNAKMEYDLDPSIGNINIVPQEIGRVLLNLITNAFYAVSEKKKVLGESFDPVVSVSSKKMEDKILISIKDNGNGIPDKVVDKIFQPFFTTKPTGQGTGLGLSLAYDIVKAHGGTIEVKTHYCPPGGELNVETKEARPSRLISEDQVGRGEGLPAGAIAQAGSKFTINLPVN